LEATNDGLPVGKPCGKVGTYLDDFQQREEEYLRKLARAAIVRRIPLRTIAIRFTAFAEFSTQTARKGLKYPWDCMNRLAAEILPSGIQLSYNKPTVTRKEFNVTKLLGYYPGGVSGKDNLPDESEFVPAMSITF
jgi:hypothetical protein